MSVGEFIDKSLHLDTPEALFAGYVDALGEFGVDRVMYAALSLPNISHCYPEDWVAFYVENGFVDIDPVRAVATTARNAFTWDDMMQVHDLSAEQKRVMDMGEEAGLKSGLAVPLHGPVGEVYGVGMASSVPNPDAARHLKEIQILSTHFHILYFDLHDALPSVAGVSLTPRELEVLKWCAAGKSNWAIGEILGISEHGVDFHMRNILRKLNADNRITAVVKALHAGLLAF